MSRGTRICGYIGIAVMSVTSVFGGICSADFNFDTYIESKPYDEIFDAGGGEASIDLGSTLQDDVTDTDGVLLGLLEVLGIEFQGDEQKAFAYIRNLINYFLVIIGLVALCVLVYGFYNILISDGEEGVANARKIVTGAFIALFIIGLARFITTFAFEVFYTSSDGI